MHTRVVGARACEYEVDRGACVCTRECINVGKSGAHAHTRVNIMQMVVLCACCVCVNMRLILVRARARACV